MFWGFFVWGLGCLWFRVFWACFVFVVVVGFVCGFGYLDLDWFVDS